MKKFIFIISAFLYFFSSEAFAQQLRVKAGLNISSFNLGDSELNEVWKSRLGFHLGATVEIPISEQFLFEPGLLLSTKGANASDEGIDIDGFGETYTYSGEASMSLTYLDIPLNAKMLFDLEEIIDDLDDVNFYLQFGPYFSYGLGGKYNVEYLENGRLENQESWTVEWGNEGDFKRLDYGVNFGFGVEFEAWQIGMNYQLGLANIEPWEDESSVNNRVLGLITVGYRIGED